MAQLWDKYPLTGTELLKKVRCEAPELADTTIKTQLRRLIQKGAVGYRVDEKNGKRFYYFPLVCEHDCMMNLNRHFLEHYYHNDIEKLFNVLADSVDIPDGMVACLRQMWEKRERMGNYEYSGV